MSQPARPDRLFGAFVLVASLAGLALARVEGDPRPQGLMEWLLPAAFLALLPLLAAAVVAERRLGRAAARLPATGWRGVRLLSPLGLFLAALAASLLAARVPGAGWLRALVMPCLVASLAWALARWSGRHGRPG